jgi:hypothetical protein
MTCGAAARSGNVVPRRLVVPVANETDGRAPSASALWLAGCACRSRGWRISAGLATAQAEASDEEYRAQGEPYPGAPFGGICFRFSRTPLELGQQLGRFGRGLQAIPEGPPLAQASVTRTAVLS